MYTENINVIIAMDGYTPTEKNNISLLAISGANVLSAVCIQEPQKNETYRNELLKISHTDFLTNTMVEIGVITGYNLRDVYTDKFWDDLNYYKLDREFIIGSIQPYLLNSNQISNLPRHVVIDKLKRKYGWLKSFRFITIQETCLKHTQKTLTKRFSSIWNPTSKNKKMCLLSRISGFFLQIGIFVTKPIKR